MKAIELLAVLGEALAGTLLARDLRSMRFDRSLIARDRDCSVYAAF